MVDVESRPTPEPPGILVVEDHPRVRESLATWLRAVLPEHPVRCAANAAEAFLRMEESAARIVLMDVGLPDQDGITACAGILRLHPDTRVVILTIHEAPTYRERAAAAGAAAYVPKRTMGADLVPCLQRLLRDLAAPPPSESVGGGS